MAADKKKTIELMKLDLYGLLGILSDAAEKDIKSAYRKKALQYHPDKNPDNPKAAQLFQQLTDALEILADPLTRATYDKLLRAKENAALQQRELDAKRRKLKEDLEAREKGVQDVKASEEELARQLQRDIERLRTEGSKILQEENRRMQELVREELARARQQATDEVECPRLKIKWNPKLGRYDDTELERLLKRHGRIVTLAVSKKKPGSAMVEFEEARSAQSALRYEKGLSTNPLTLSWASGSGPREPQASASVTAMFPSSDSSQRSVQDDLDFESMVLAKMRAKAQEQKVDSA
ncbi:dnaJsubfamily C member 17-like [Tropilaelaps mercedesae]|uniref:DnaJsubfamily C member 17-like n=1 Tax=Tropilaelaps mercedesae TaxID=418985 RepID=A0A1V9XVH5_9ACAR|nr:dnaJsubfamily C member 17-like [Tropilaelaps mercedesae]